MIEQNYRHTQIGYLTLIVMVVVAFAIVGMGSRGARPIAIGVASVLAVVTVLFSSLTVEVSGGELSFHFGPGFWRKHYALGDIVSATATRSNWLEGWGIRITPRGMLYNVSGSNAVEIELRSGERFRIGTDDPDGLVRALSARIPATANRP